MFDETVPTAGADARPEPPGPGDESEVPVGWPEFHRAALGRHCAGLSDGRLRMRPVPPSPLSLITLARAALDDVVGSPAARHEHMARNREIVAAAPSLDTPGARWKQNPRWGLTEVTQEYMAPTATPI